MSKNLIIGIIIVLVIALGGVFIANQQSEKQEEAKMAQEKASMKATDDASMKKTDEKMDGGEGEEAMMGIGFILKNGKMMLDNKGVMSPMTEIVTLKDGSTVSLTGQVSRKDGTKVQLKEGQSIWHDGSIVDAKAMENEKENAAMEK